MNNSRTEPHFIENKNNKTNRKSGKLNFIKEKLEKFVGILGNNVKEIKGN